MSIDENALAQMRLNRAAAIAADKPPEQAGTIVAQPDGRRIAYPHVIIAGVIDQTMAHISMVVAKEVVKATRNADRKLEACTRVQAAIIKLRDTGVLSDPVQHDEAVDSIIQELGKAINGTYFEEDAPSQITVEEESKEVL
jgi:hypothetical protein